MKKLLLFISLSLIILPASSQVEFSSFIEAGYEDRIISLYDYNNLGPNEWIGSNSLHNSLFATFENRLNYKWITLYSSVKTNARYKNPVKYDPLQAEFITGLSVLFKKLEFRIEHMCSHSIDRLYFKEAYDRISIRYQLF